MKKILVPTDFSPNTKSGIRFAIQWAAQQNLELVFIHVLNIMIPTRWPEGTVAKYIAGEKKACGKRFSKFIDTVYKSMNIKPGLYSTVLKHEYNPAKTVLEYCRKDKTIDCICISTNGAGSVMKLFGTNTSELIAKSPIPVLAIPKNYKPKEVKRILYATDFRNYKEELAKVIRFASALCAKVDVVHFAWPGELQFEEEALEKLSRDYEYGLNVDIEECDPSVSLNERLQKTILKRKPSVVIMFSNKERNLMQKLFLSSKAKELSFSLKAPLLVYCKVMAPIKTKKHELA
ncbi:MAG: universal stress protein [Chitinophagaceae bacterium]|nr:universal stress protein [Chitinophagaceae bacterium]